MTKKLMLTRAANLLVLLSVATLLAWTAATPPVSAQPAKTLTPEHSSFIASTAAKVLRHIAQARADIHEKKLDKAAEEVKGTGPMIETLKASLPTASVRDHIWVAKTHLSYEDPHEVYSDLIPIYAALDNLEGTIPVTQARAHIDAAKQSLDKGDVQKASEELTAAGDALLYFEVDLPLATTEIYLYAAQRELANKESAQAETALGKAEGGLQVISVALETPIFRAQQSLGQATENYAAGKLAEAKANLQQAKVALERAAKAGDTKIQTEAQALREEVTQLYDSMGSHQAGTRGRIASLWGRTRALFERGYERWWTDWAEFQASAPGTTDLVDARMHIAYAQSYQLETADSQKAQAELEKAKTYVEQAESHLKTEAAPRLATIKKDLAAAQADVGKQGPAIRERYEKMEADLLYLIRRVYLAVA